MPELPEVETVRRVIGPQIRGRRAEAVSVLSESAVAHPRAEVFRAELAGQAFAGMGRRGKFLIFDFESGDRMLLHLRMTGRLLVVPAGTAAETHTRVVIKLSGGDELRFADLRRFGRFWFFKSGEEDRVSGVFRLGPEPDDPALTAGYLAEKLGGSRRAVKEALLDQSVVAGIGNIYSDEILFSCGIRPDTPCRGLSPADFEALAAEIPRAIAFFTEKNSIAPGEYLAGGGSDYRNTPYLRVYGRAKEPCRICGETLVRTVIGGRGSVFCPRCQKGRTE